MTFAIVGTVVRYQTAPNTAWLCLEIPIGGPFDVSLQVMIDYHEARHILTFPAAAKKHFCCLTLAMGRTDDCARVALTVDHVQQAEICSIAKAYVEAYDELRFRPYHAGRFSEDFMLQKVGKKYVLFTSDGSRVLGEHRTKAAAVAQERAIQIDKARRAGHRIPRRKRASRSSR